MAMLWSDDDDEIKVDPRSGRPVAPDWMNNVMVHVWTARLAAVGLLVSSLGSMDRGQTGLALLLLGVGLFVAVSGERTARDAVEVRARLAEATADYERAIRAKAD